MDVPAKQPFSPAERVLALLGLATVFAVLLDISLYLLWFAHPGNDQAWLLYAAGRMLAGTTLYGPALTETNPPLIIWFSAIPMLVARWLHLFPIVVLRGLVSLMIFASVAWCWRILRAAGLAATPIMGCFAVLALLASELAQHGNDFGQKEQLLIVFLLPFLLYAAAAPRVRFGWGERVAMGLAAGLAVSFKPQDILIVVFFELALLITSRDLRRLLRAELLALILTVVTYVVVVRLLAPLYLSHTVPLLQDTYWAFGDMTAFQVVRARSGFNTVFLLTFVALLVFRKRLHGSTGLFALLMATVGAALAFAIQNKNWPYQFFPQQALLCTAIVWLLLDLATTWAERTRAGATLIPLTALCTALSFPAFFYVGHRHAPLVSQSPDSEFLDKTLAANPPGTTVFILSINLMGTSDVLSDGLLWSGRYIHLWMLPALVRNEIALSGGPPARKTLSARRLQQLSELQRSDVTDDLRTRQPTEVVVPHCLATTEEPCQGLYGMSFDILAWFRRSPAFAAEWANYQRVDGDAFFDVYRRTRSQSVKP